MNKICAIIIREGFIIVFQKWKCRDEIGKIMVVGQYNK